jgi:Ni,Fe-hydrogenase III component G
MMELESIIQNAIDLMQPYTLEINQPVPRRVDIRIQSTDLVPAVKTLQEAKWGYLVAITGLDHPAPTPAEGEPEAENHLEVLYAFGHGPALLMLRISVPYSAASVPSVCGLIPSATLYERELFELFGVEVIDTPDKTRLILPDEWPEGVYPMRKSFKGLRTLRLDEEGPGV